MATYEVFIVLKYLIFFFLISTYSNKCGLGPYHNKLQVYIWYQTSLLSLIILLCYFCRNYSSILIIWLHAIDLVIALYGE